MKYKYFIEKIGCGYTFALYPNNSNSQAIGKSNIFNSFQEAKNKLEQFKSYVSANGSEVFEIIKTDDKFKFLLKRNEYGFEFNREKSYWQKSGVKNGITRIIENINAPFEIR